MIEPGKAYENNDRVVFVEANGTPFTFDVLEVSVSTLSVLRAGTINRQDLEKDFTEYVSSKKRLVLK